MEFQTVSVQMDYFVTSPAIHNSALALERMISNTRGQSPYNCVDYFVVLNSLSDQRVTWNTANENSLKDSLVKRPRYCPLV